MRNKVKKRLNNYFGPKFWAGLNPEQKQQYVKIGAHRIWRASRLGSLINITVPGRSIQDMLNEEVKNEEQTVKVSESQVAGTIETTNKETDGGVQDAPSSGII